MTVVKTSFPTGIKRSVCQVGFISALLCRTEMSCEDSYSSRLAIFHLRALRQLTAKIIDAEQPHNGEHSKSIQDAIKTHRKTPLVRNVVERPHVMLFDTATSQVSRQSTLGSQIKISHRCVTNESRRS